MITIFITPLSVRRGRRGLDGGDSGGGNAAAFRNVAATSPSSPHRHRCPNTHTPSHRRQAGAAVGAVGLNGGDRDGGGRHVRPSPPPLPPPPGPSPPPPPLPPHQPPVETRSF
jgi:hypothetical protein